MTKYSFLIYNMILIIIISIIIIGFNCWIGWISSKYIYNDIRKLSNKDFGLILGTSKYSLSGLPNEYYMYRIQGAIDLYYHGKIKYLLISGDNSHVNYNEPILMRKDLIAAGIPSTKIILDFAGFRTLDSIIRAHQVFLINNFIIISQRFHCERAVFIAIIKGIKTQCYAVTSPKQMVILRIREFFARINTLIDLFFINKKPYFSK